MPGPSKFMIDLANKRFGHLIVITRAPNNPKGNAWNPHDAVNIQP